MSSLQDSGLVLRKFPGRRFALAWAMIYRLMQAIFGIRSLNPIPLLEKQVLFFHSLRELRSIFHSLYSTLDGFFASKFNAVSYDSSCTSLRACVLGSAS